MFRRLLVLFIAIVSPIVLPVSSFAWAPASGWSIVSLQGSDEVDQVGFFGVNVNEDSLGSTFYHNVLTAYNNIVPFNFVLGTADYYPTYFLKSDSLYSGVVSGGQTIQFNLICQPVLVSSTLSSWKRSFLYLTGEPAAFQFSGVITTGLSFVGVQLSGSQTIEPYSRYFPVAPIINPPELYDVVYINGNSTNYDWNIPFKFEYSNEVNYITSYSIAKRRKSLSLAVSGESLPSGTICVKVKNVLCDNVFDIKNKTRFNVFNYWRDYTSIKTRLFSRSLIEAPPDNYLNASTFDLDGGGQYDLNEWAQFTNRFDPTDDKSCVGSTNTDPEPDSSEDEPVSSSVVEAGRETADSYRRLISVQVGSSAELETTSPSEVELPTVEKSVVSSRETTFNAVKSRVESALQHHGKYEALKALFAPLDSANYPTFALPVTNVTVSGQGQSFTTDFQTENLSIDFASIEENQTGSIFAAARKLAALSIVLATGWAIYKMFLGVFGSPTTESGQGETPSEPDSEVDSDEDD